jgi:hypothetical protein
VSALFIVAFSVSSCEFEGTNVDPSSARCSYLIYVGLSTATTTPNAILSSIKL